MMMDRRTEEWLDWVRRWGARTHLMMEIYNYLSIMSGAGAGGRPAAVPGVL